MNSIVLFWVTTRFNYFTQAEIITFEFGTLEEESIGANEGSKSSCERCNGPSEKKCRLKPGQFNNWSYRMIGYRMIGDWLFNPFLKRVCRGIVLE